VYARVYMGGGCGYTWWVGVYTHMHKRLSACPGLLVCVHAVDDGATPGPPPATRPLHCTTYVTVSTMLALGTIGETEAPSLQNLSM
jgi:hypothetical protein